MTRVTRTVGGHTIFLDLDPASGVQKSMIDAVQSGVGYENATEAWLVATLRPGDHVVDAGAHVGYFTTLMARCVGPTGHVWAFEPNPQNYQRLLHHVQLNLLDHVTPLHMALGARSQSMDLWINRDNDGGHALYDVGRFASNTKSRQSPEAYPVWVSTLDDLGIPVPQVMKMDVEGGEHAIMQGLAGHPRAFVSEIHATGLQMLGSSEAAYRADMARRGYVAYLPCPDGSLEPLGQRTTENTVFNVVFQQERA